jgi:DNA modification methylase
MGKLNDKFVISPFSVLNARAGDWQDRKRYWIALGIKSELGRGENSGDDGLLRDLEQARSHYKGGSVATATGGHGLCNALAPRSKMNGNPNSTEHGLLIDDYRYHQSNGKGLARCFGPDLMKGENANFGKRLTWVAGDKPENELDEVSRKILSAQPQSGTSIFDPVLCELMYKWFVPIGGSILDPFAGGSVRGVVAASLGYKYTGIDLRPEQIDANNVQASEILKDIKPEWIVGDSRNLKTITNKKFDSIFSCPPYYDLEIYSDDTNDLSKCSTYDEFILVYREIIQNCVDLLEDNRFACFVVGDIRDKQGFYRCFPSDTIKAFQDAGMKLYNEAILVTAVGSLPVRVQKSFGGYRKLGKSHQNVLIFYKGNVKKIPEYFSMPDMLKDASEGELLETDWSKVEVEKFEAPDVAIPEVPCKVEATPPEKTLFDF